MMDPFDTRFFGTLGKVCAETPGLDPAFAATVAAAVETGDPQDLRAARLAFDRLDAATRDRVMREVHRKLAMDIGGLWDSLPTAPTRQRPN